MTLFTKTKTPTYSEINRHFVIRWRDHLDPSTKGNLIGAGKYAEKFGARYAALHFEKAMISGQQRITVKIRGKYIITFNSK